MQTDDKEITAHAKALVAERRYQEAVRACRRSLVVRPDDVETKLLLGMALVALRRYDELRAEMLGLVRMAPEQGTVHRLLGEAFLRTGDPRKAQEHLNRARALDPDDTSIVELLTEAQSEAPPSDGTVERWLVPEEGGGSVRARRRDRGNGTNATYRHASNEAEGEGLQERANAVASESEEDADEEMNSGISFRDRTEGEDERLDEGLEARGDAVSDDEEVSEAEEDVLESYEELKSEDEDAESVPANSAEEDAAAAADADGDHRRAGRDPSSRTAELGLDDLVRQRYGLPPTEGGKKLPGEDAISGELTRAPTSQEEYRERAIALSREDLSGEEPTAIGTGEHKVEVDVEELRSEPTAARAETGNDKVTRARTTNDDEIDETTIARSTDGADLPEVPTLARISNAPEPEDNETIQRQISDADSGLREDTAEHALPPAPGGSRIGALPVAGGARAAAPAASGLAKFAPVPLPPPSQSHGDRARALAGNTVAQARAWVQSRKRLSVILGSVGGALLLLFVAVFMLSAWQSSSRLSGVQAAAQQAGDDGLEASLISAVTAVLPAENEKASDIAKQDPARIALLARLDAVGVLEHRIDAGSHAEQMLALLHGKNAELPDARIAAAYLALSKGDVPEATSAIAGMQTPEPDAEAMRARGLVAHAAGQITQALDSAGAALALRPQAPRHAALYAVFAAQKGDVQDALRALQSVPGGEQSPAVRIARARVLQDSGRDPTSATSEATAILGELGERSTATQKAWAHLVLAKAHADAGEDSRSLQELGAAQEQWPLGDFMFDLKFVETLLDVSAVSQARELMRQLEGKPLPPLRKARVDAELALASGDLAEAEEAITAMGNSEQATFLSGRLYEARGDLDRARALYEELMDDPTHTQRAKIRLATLELGAGNAQRSIEILQPLVNETDANPRLTYLYVRALLAAGDTPRAEQMVRAALEQQRDVPELLRASADVALTLGRNTEALAMMTAAVQQRPRDPEMQAALGEAARRAGDAAQARTAFTRALEINAAQQTALVSLVQMNVESGNSDGARQALERAEAAGAPDAVLAAARGSMAVVEGGGEAAIASLRELATPSAGAEAWAALGWAYVQAERDREAGDAFKTALRAASNNIDSHLGLALIETRMGNLDRAEDRITDAERSARTTGVTPEITARIAAARGRIQFELGDFGAAERKAREALRADPRCADANLLLANIAIERGDDPKPLLRAAVGGQAPPPEAVGRLAVLLARGEEACRLAARYLQAAPRGYDARDVRKVASSCPQSTSTPQ